VAAPPRGVPVVGDAVKVGRVVQNLMHNAIKFTPAGKKIAVTIAGVPEKGVVEIEIVDAGTGMPEQHIERMFQPFQQMDSSLRRQFSGLGLGLTVARRLTDFLGGSLQIKSQRDVGTQVTLRVPARPVVATIGSHRRDH
jgi:signal transduction histidine kinase